MKKALPVFAAVCPAVFMLLSAFILSLAKDLSDSSYSIYPRVFADIALGLAAALYVVLFAKTLLRFRGKATRIGAAVGIALALILMIIGVYTDIMPFLYAQLHALLLFGTMCIATNVIFISGK